jgi:hypothetical protein
MEGGEGEKDLPSSDRDQNAFAHEVEKVLLRLDRAGVIVFQNPREYIQGIWLILQVMYQQVMKY